MTKSESLAKSLGELLEKSPIGEVIDLVDAMQLSPLITRGWANAVKIDEDRVIFRINVHVVHPEVGPLHLHGDLAIVHNPKEKTA